MVVDALLGRAAGVQLEARFQLLVEPFHVLVGT
jgi:hypothetical protein